jgi:hypothetical protein
VGGGGRWTSFHSLCVPVERKKPLTDLIYFWGSNKKQRSCDGRERGRAAPRLAWQWAQKDGCAQCTGAHARPKPTSMFMFDWSALMTPQKANLDSLRTLSWIISYWRLALIFQHSLSDVTRGIYLSGSPSTIYHYFSSLTCLYVLRSLGTDLSGINKAFSQVILLKGNVSGDDIFLRSLNLNYYFSYMGWRFKHFWIAYLLW